MLLGTFAFVGLKVSGPDMRATAEEFYRQHQLADLTVTSTLGLDETDQRLINETKGLKSRIRLLSGFGNQGKRKQSTLIF